MMPDTFTLDEVTALLSTLLTGIRAGGGLEDGAYTLQQVSDRTGFAVTALTLACRAEEIEHVKYGNAIGMTPVQVAKLLKQCTRGGDVVERLTEFVSLGDQDEMAVARKSSRRSADQQPRRKEVA